MAASVWITTLLLGTALVMLATIRARRVGTSRVSRARPAGYAARERVVGPHLFPGLLAPASLAVSLCCSACVGTGFPSFLGLGSAVLDELRSHDAGSTVAGSGTAGEEPVPAAPALTPETVLFGLLALLTAQAGLAPLLTRCMREPSGALGVIAATMLVLLFGSVLPAAAGLGAFVLGRVREDNRPSKDSP